MRKREKETEPFAKKARGSLREEREGQDRNTDKLWCPEGGRYQYVEVCRASCKKPHKCAAYAEYREPKLI